MANTLSLVTVNQISADFGIWRLLRGRAAAMAVREEADVTDAVEPVRNDVQQEPANEFTGSERHHLGLAVLAIVLPGEVDLAIGEAGQTRIGQCDAMGIAAEIR